MTKEKAIKMLLAEGYGLPRSIEIYNMLSCNGFYEITRKDIIEYIGK